MHLAEYYQIKDINLAEKYALQAFQMGLNTKNPDDKIEALQFLTNISDGSESKKYAIQAFKLNDSIVKVRQQAKNQFAKIKYDANLALEESRKQKQLKEYFIV